MGIPPAGRKSIRCTNEFWFGVRNGPEIRKLIEPPGRQGRQVQKSMEDWRFNSGNP